MSLNSIQRRYPWLVAPSHLLEFIITPERWSAVVEDIAAAFTRICAADSTPLARFLARIDLLSPARHVLLRRSAVLRWIDWKMRKTFWAGLWCGVIATDLRPRRVPVPEPEKPIRLLRAPDTYADFKAPALVVPDNVPRGEKSFGTRVGVQIIHLLQDLYPIVTTHQADAHSDPQKRFDAAYSFLYRATRDTPRWHPDLVEASHEGKLLNALAVGGPFAKLLQRVAPDSDNYVIDLEHFRNYRVHDGLCHLGVRIEYVAQGRQLALTGIRYDNCLVTPQHPRWEMTERIAQAALLTHVTVWRQGMEYHVGGLAALPIQTHNHLPAAHPLRRLLAPHLTRWMTTSMHTHVTLRRSGFDVTGFAFPCDVILRYYDDGAAAFDIARLDVALDAERRGVPDSLDYPYQAQAMRYRHTIEQYVRRYVECYYPTEASLGADPYPRIWFEALDATLVRGIRGYVPGLTRDNLVKLCTTLIYSASVAHTENSLTNYAGFMPTTVRQDGRQQSVGQVQNTINFQLLIATPSVWLVGDHSHVALDPRGAAIMRRFRADLLDMEREMEAQPSRYWQVFPSEIESSVTC